jgi:hypothetical protein
VATVSSFSDPEDVERIDMPLGSDHGQGAFTFMALLTVRYTKKSKKDGSKYLAMQIGQIESEVDSVEMLKPLVATIEKGVRRIKPTNEGDAQFIVREQDGVSNRTTPHRESLFVT